MKDQNRLIAVALVLILLPIVFLYFYYDRGEYVPGDLPQIDDSGLIDTLPAYRTYRDKPAEGGGIVIFDLSHDNNTTINDLSPLRDRIANRGAEIMDFDSHTGFQVSALRGASALVIISPTSSYSDLETEAIIEFAEDGGRVLLVADPTRTADLDAGDLFSALFPESAVPAINSIASAFGIVYVDDYLYNIEENEGNYRNVILRDFEKENALTDGVRSMVVFAAHSLRSDGIALATSDSNTFSPLRTGETGLSPVVLSQDGQVLALGDLTFLTPPYHTMAYNDRFLSNIADWLATAERDWDITDFPYLFERPVDLIPISDGPVDSQLISRVNALDNVLAEAGLSVRLSAGVNKDRDSIRVGTFSDAEEVDEFLELGQIDLSDNELIESAELGDFSTEGTTLFITSKSSIQVNIVILAEDSDAIIDALDLLIRSDFSNCVQGDVVTICSTSSRSNGSGSSGSDNESEQASNDCSYLATTEPIDSDFPRLGSVDETECYINNGLAFGLEFYSDDFFSDAEFEPGDLFTYTIFLEDSTDIIWFWNWCTTDGQLEQNWENITLTFTLNDVEIPLSQFYVEDIGDDDFACRSYYLLVTDWPDGEHLLITEIVFEIDLDSGLGEYDAGLRTYIYEVTVGS